MTFLVALTFNGGTEISGLIKYDFNCFEDE